MRFTLFRRNGRGLRRTGKNQKSVPPSNAKARKPTDVQTARQWRGLRLAFQPPNKRSRLASRSELISSPELKESSIPVVLVVSQHGIEVSTSVSSKSLPNDATKPLPTPQFTGMEDVKVVNRNTLIRIKYEPGIRNRVIEHLNRCQPVLLPLPSPLPYIVIGRDPAMVNRTKGRPATQAVARIISSMEDFDDLMYFDDDRGLKEAERLLFEERMTVLCPVLPPSTTGVDLVGSQTDRQAALSLDLVRRRSSKQCGLKYALFHASVPLRGDSDVCSRENELYGSSGNYHGCAYGQTLDDICKQFQNGWAKNEQSGEGCVHMLVLDAEHMRDFSYKHESTSMARVDPVGDVLFNRDGVHHLYWDSKSWRMSEEQIKQWTLC